MQQAPTMHSRRHRPGASKRKPDPLTLALQPCKSMFMDDSTPASSSLLASPVDSGDPAAPGLYGLEELLALAGERLGEEITPRTVRLYATQGLIDMPGREGRSAVYGRRHLLQLLLIRSLARRGLSLAAIAPLIGLADDELEQQLGQLQGDGSPASLTPEFPSSLASERNDALDYLQSLQPSASDKAPSAAAGAESLERSASLLPLLGSPLSSLPSSRPSSRSSTRSPSRSGGSREAASRWHRFTLAPGVELQISDSVSVPPPGSRRMAWLNRLVARLLEQLEDAPP